MPEIQCSNPRCQRANPADVIFCRFCGWRLAQPQSQVPPPNAMTLDQLQAALQQLQSQHDQLTATHDQLATNHEQLAASHQLLAKDHSQAVSELAETKQQAQAVGAQKQDAEAQVQALLAQIAELTTHINAASTSSPATQEEIAQLKQKLTAAETELAGALEKVRTYEESPIGQATRPLWSKLLSWALLPIIGSVGGAELGIHTSFNPYKAQSASSQVRQNQQTDQVASIQQQLTSVRQSLDKAQQDLNAEKQSNAQLSTQVTDLSKKSQSSANQLTGLQKQLNDAKAETAKEHTAAVQVQQQLQVERAQSQQLVAKAATASSLQNIIDHHPYLSYKGPTQGIVTITFTGKNDKPNDIVIDHFHASGNSNAIVRSIAGTPFPNVPQVVEPVSKNVTIVSPPTAANSWQKITISVQGKNTTQAVLRWSVF